jgi:hypothetical protein
LTEYEFIVEGQVEDSDTVENRNEFKKFRGIVGFLTEADGVTPLVGVSVVITRDGDIVFEGITDDDGFYGWNYFHKGKPATYIVTFDIATNPFGEVVLKAGHFAEVSYPTP